MHSSSATRLLAGVVWKEYLRGVRARSGVDRGGARYEDLLAVTDGSLAPNSFFEW